ncbi:hypothetical protein RRG08_061684 [Elysia crispata]|uniref:DDE-1 domain-containing protein n=1 Tax=Elysia crispata TaxID=231223 RepID=A0AAE0ZDH6_9GAST|nr:hypothetical protein RRG08_061684 [Elysia crispata]
MGKVIRSGTEIDKSCSDTFALINLLLSRAKGAGKGAIQKLYAEKKTCQFVPFLPPGRPVVLIFDGHASHLNIATIQEAIKYEIIIVKLPSNSTHVLQPLDVGVYGPVKTAWETILVKFARQNLGTPLNKELFPSLLAQFWKSDSLSEKKCESWVPQPKKSVANRQKAVQRLFGESLTSAECVQRLDEEAAAKISKRPRPGRGSKDNQPTKRAAREVESVTQPTCSKAAPPASDGEPTAAPVPPVSSDSSDHKGILGSKKKRRDRYAEKTAQRDKAIVENTPTQPQRQRGGGVVQNLRRFRDKLKHARTKMAIWKAKFAQALLNKENVNNLPDISSFYKPMVAKIGPLQVAKFMESNAVDYPELKGSSSYKKMSSSDSEDGSGDVPLMQLLMLQRQLNLKRDKYKCAMKTTNGAVLSSGPDLRHHTIKYRTRLAGTGGGPPPKKPTFYDEVMDVIEEKKTLLCGIPGEIMPNTRSVATIEEKESLAPSQSLGGGRSKKWKTATPRLTSLLRGVIRTVKKSISELALIKLDLAKKRMAREKPEDITGVRGGDGVMNKLKMLDQETELLLRKGKVFCDRRRSARQTAQQDDPLATIDFAKNLSCPIITIN